MHTEILVLAWGAVLLLVHIFAAAQLKTRQYGIEWNAGPRDASQPPLEKYAGRLVRAQANMLETFPIAIAALLGRGPRRAHQRRHRARRVDLAGRAGGLPSALLGRRERRAQHRIPRQHRRPRHGHMAAALGLSGGERAPMPAVAACLCTGTSQHVPATWIDPPALTSASRAASCVNRNHVQFVRGKPPPHRHIRRLHA